MQVYPIGSITFVMSENHRLELFVSNDLARSAVDEFVSHFKNQLRANKLDNSIMVLDVSWGRGCVTIVLTLGIIGGAAGGIALAEILKKYKESREGVVAILEDIKNMKLWIKRKVKKAISPKEGVDESKKLQKPMNDVEVLKTLFDRATHDLQLIPQDQRKYFSSGAEIQLPDGHGNICLFNVSVKRVDIVPPERMIEIKGDEEKTARHGTTPSKKTSSVDDQSQSDQKAIDKDGNHNNNKRASTITKKKRGRASK